MTTLRPAHPERICWGCSRLCRSDDLACGNGTVRTPHPIELFGEDWAPEDESRDEDSGVAIASEQDRKR